MNPFFSVILPIYNVEQYLERCVRSVEKQSFRDYELILVDDGSTDISGQICDKLAERHDNIRVIHKENGGLSSARNAGIEIARGEYIWWVDSDDWISPCALSILYATAKFRQQDIIKFNHIRVTHEEKMIASIAAPGEYILRNQIKELIQQAFTKTSKYILSAWSHIYRRQFLEENQLRFVSEREIGSEDYLFNLQAILLAERVSVIEESLYYYEQRMGSLTQRYKCDLPQRYMRLYHQIRDFYQQNGALEQCEPMINQFYVWHLIHGICIPNEYYVSQDHTMFEGRKNIIAFMKIAEFRGVVKRLMVTTDSWKQYVELLAMYWHVESLFHWLYVTKPRMKKERRNVTQDQTK